MKSEESARKHRWGRSPRGDKQLERRGHRIGIVLTLLAMGVLLAGGLTTERMRTRVAAQSPAASPKPTGRYSAEIRRTSHGIPHIKAADIGSLGFGEGYAFAQDHLCSLADQIVKARGDRARFFGPGENNRHLNNDLTMKALGLAEQARDLYQSLPEPQRAMLDGYVAGYNQYLSEVGVAGVPGWCRGQEWVFPITAIDLLTYNQSVVVTTTNFADLIATAEPPKAERAAASPTEIPEFEQASNGWALGKDWTASRRGMLIANPHYPWVGSNRFWEKHLTIPGELDVYGVGLLGSPGVSIGFNRAVAWTHTVSAGKRFTVYSLDLVPGEPTKYLYQGQPRAMSRQTITVAVRQPNGSTAVVNREIYSSHYGPILNFPGIGWSAKRTVSIRDANANNVSVQAQWMAMNRARSLEEFKEAHARYNAMPWVNTIAASADGRAWYTDSAATPALSPEALRVWKERRERDLLTRTAWERGIVLLDGSNPLFEWTNDPATRPGVIPFSKIPQLERTDYVFNANDSFWLANPRQLLTGFSPLQGEEETSRSLRTRMNVRLLEDKEATGKDGRFSLEEMSATLLSNRSLSAEMLRGELVARCEQSPKAVLEGTTVDLQSACRILKSWDGRYELESVGPVLWREFIGQYDPADLQRKGRLFDAAFTATDPVGTPHTLASEAANSTQPTHLQRLARAVRLLEEAGIALDTPLGKVQYADRNGRRIPMHGGDGAYDGIANFVNFAPNTTTLEPTPVPQRVRGSRFLTREGYPINRGTSFLMALEYTAKGPRAQAFLTYSQSGDPTSPQFLDQTQLFSDKQWRSIRFTEQEIRADRNLKTVRVISR
ncbi:MAG: acylase [Blastocatellia bacterium]